MFLAIEGRLAGVLAVGDPLKETTPAALQALKASGVRLVMLTGDNQTSAQAVARSPSHRRGDRGGSPHG